jgi:ribosomal-protein-alanine N-acetyltransferase
LFIVHVSYELSKDYWGKGYATEAVASILNFIFCEGFHFYVHSVEVLILPINRPSEKSVKNLGLRPKGTLHCKCYCNNDFHEMNMYAELHNEQL